MSAGVYRQIKQVGTHWIWLGRVSTRIGTNGVSYITPMMQRPRKTAIAGIKYHSGGTVRRFLWEEVYKSDPGEKQVIIACGNDRCVNPKHCTLEFSEERALRGRRAGT